MTQFEIMSSKGNEIRCDICGAPMTPIYGGGWENDKMVCTNLRSCVAEIVFPTSTEVEETK